MRKATETESLWMDGYKTEFTYGEGTNKNERPAGNCWDHKRV